MEAGRGKHIETQRNQGINFLKTDCLRWACFGKLSSLPPLLEVQNSHKHSISISQACLSQLHGQVPLGAGKYLDTLKHMGQAYHM